MLPSRAGAFWGSYSFHGAFITHFRPKSKRYGIAKTSHCWES
jgi:hypothetical protein